MQHSKLTTMATILLTAIFILAGCSSAPSGIPQAKAGTGLRKVQDRGRLLVGIKYDLPTFGYRNPQTGKLEGFDAAIAREIAAYLFGDPNKIEFVEAVTKDRIPFLQNGTIDIAVATFIITEDRLKDVDFSVVYYGAGGRLLVPKDSAIKSINDLDGKKVGTPQGSVYATTLPQLSKATMVTFNSDSAALDAMLKNQVDATTNNDANLYGLALLNPSVKIVGAAYTSEGFGVGVAKGNAELLDAVNSAISNLKSSGKWKTIWKAEIGDKFGIATVPEPPRDNWK
jgi:aspartate/glutamate/glutamine transport system substrate-binding protein